MHAIKSVLDRVFEECNTPYQTDPYDIELHELCMEEGRRRGFNLGPGANEVDPNRYLRCGVIIASGAYAHLSRRLQMFIALFTAFATWIDDFYSEHLEGVDVFYDRFFSNERQHNRGLDSMASIIRETSSLYGATAQSSIIVMATLRFISGTMLEYEGRTISMSSSSRRFSTYLRSFTGIAEAYTMFVFPPETNIRQYMQAVPDMCFYINHYNDLLSFYKEEKAREANNYISLEAAALREDKLVTLDRLASEVAECSRRINHILGDPSAIAAFEVFKKGYLSFHTSLEQRYKLRDLFA